LKDRVAVPDWLNAAKGSESYAKVAKLIHSIRRVESLVDKFLAENSLRFVGVKRVSAEIDEQYRELLRTEEWIDEALSKYKYSPRMMNDCDENRWLLSMYSAQTPTGFVLNRKKSGIRYKGIMLTATRSKTVYLQTIGEADIVLRILNLSAASELERLKQCARCSKWLYAERSHQKFCPGGECRKEKYAQSPKYKEYRKQYMRQMRSRQAAEQSKKPLQVKHNDDRP
jgi:hypothetical protein